MKKYIILLLATFILSYVENYAQEISEKESIEKIATKYLNSISNQSMTPSNLISTKSLEKAKSNLLKMIEKMDSSTAHESKSILSPKEYESMTAAEIWDYMENLNDSRIGKMDLQIKWNIVITDIKDDEAIVTYNVKDKEQKVMRLKKEEDNWKVVLSFASIF